MAVVIPKVVSRKYRYILADTKNGGIRINL